MSRSKLIPNVGEHVTIPQGEMGDVLYVVAESKTQGQAVVVTMVPEYLWTQAVGRAAAAAAMAAGDE